MTRWGAHLASVTRAWFPGGVLLLLLGAVHAAHASDSLTVNTTSAYVDPSVTAEFVTVPSLCLEPYGDQGTTTGCDELGERAVLAYQGTSPYGDVYFEPQGSFLRATNAFVPENPGIFSPSGFSPIFSMHKYDLFGRAGDSMGPLTRIEILYLHELGVTSGNGTPQQTAPGSQEMRDYFAALLVLPRSATTVSPGSIAIPISELAQWRRVTSQHGTPGATDSGGGVGTGGGLDWMDEWAVEYFTSLLDPILGPGAGLLAKGSFWDPLPDFQKVALFLAGQSIVHWVDTSEEPCGHQADDTEIFTNCNARDAWMDQAVVGYVQAWESLGGDDHFAQNFRSQVGYDPSFLTLDSGTQVLTDFRLEQSVELSGAFTTLASDPGDAITPGDNMDGLAGRQTFQQAFASNSAIDAGGLFGPHTLGQMVSQDVQGYLMTCFNCEEPGASHAFQPAKQNLALMPYQSGWNVVPTIIHAP